MEEQGYIELRVTNKDNTLSPKAGVASSAFFII
jgi:hypothetical protein